MQNLPSTHSRFNVEISNRKMARKAQIYGNKISHNIFFKFFWVLFKLKLANIQCNINLRN